MADKRNQGQTKCDWECIFNLCVQVYVCVFVCMCACVGLNINRSLFPLTAPFNMRNIPEKGADLT